MFDEWDGTIKIIVASRGDYLIPYNDYTSFFIPSDHEWGFADYIISDTDKNQISEYVNKHYDTKATDHQHEDIPKMDHITQHLKEAFSKKVEIEKTIT